jgi:hypothetical protein
MIRAFCDERGIEWNYSKRYALIQRHLSAGSLGAVRDCWVSTKHRRTPMANANRQIGGT